MTTTLSPEIRKAVEDAGEQPLEIIDPETQQRYFLLKADVFDRLRVACTAVLYRWKNRNTCLSKPATARRVG